MAIRHLPCIQGTNVCMACTPQIGVRVITKTRAKTRANGDREDSIHQSALMTIFTSNKDSIWLEATFKTTLLHHHSIDGPHVCMPLTCCVSLASTFRYTPRTHALLNVMEQKSIRLCLCNRWELTRTKFFSCTYHKLVEMYSTLSILVCRLTVTSNSMYKWLYWYTLWTIGDDSNESPMYCTQAIWCGWRVILLCPCPSSTSQGILQPFQGGIARAMEKWHMMGKSFQSYTIVKSSIEILLKSCASVLSLMLLTK